MKEKSFLKLNNVRFQVFGLVLVISLFGGFVSVKGQVVEQASGHGLTAQFEIAYLQFAINHHFAALRMTELAAGTDTTRNSEISGNEGTALTPGFSATTAKATIDGIKNLARRNNRTQREEILVAQRFLHDWYGVNYEPQLTPINQYRIQILTEAPAGSQFNRLFLEVFSRHHFIISVRSLETLIASDQTHDALRRYARSIEQGQVNDINEMRELLCMRFDVCDYQPLRGLKGESNGDRFPNNTPPQFREITNDEDEDGENHNGNN